MPDGRRRPGVQLPQLAAAIVVAVAVWLVARGREPVRASVPVDGAGRAFPPGTVRAVVEGPAASVLTLRLRPPALRGPGPAGAGAPAPGPRDVALPDGAGDVTVREVVVVPPAP
jgi:hypothetical protein